MRYVGQNFELAIAIPQGRAPSASDWLKRAFLEAHQRKYGHHDPAAADRDHQRTADARKARARPSREPRRLRNMPLPPLPAARGRSGSPPTGRPTPRFVERSALAPGTALEGPLVVTQFDATTLVPPGSRLSVEDCGSLLIEVDP